MKTKVLVLVMTLLGLNVVYANDLYLDQDGNSSTIEIIQEGSDNRIGAELTPLVLNGASQDVYIKQQGDGNVLTGSIVGDAATVSNIVVGSNNTQTINCTGCDSAVINNTITGDNNVTTQTLGAAGTQYSKLTITGDYNEVTHTASGGSHRADITLTGSGASGSPNVVSVTQSGALQQQAIINATGNGININVNQSN